MTDKTQPPKYLVVSYTTLEDKTIVLFETQKEAEQNAEDEAKLGFFAAIYILEDVCRPCNSIKWDSDACNSTKWDSDA